MRFARAGRLVAPPPFWWRQRYVAAAPLVAGVIAIGVAFNTPKHFTSMARLLPPQANVNTAQMLTTRLGGNSGLGLSAMAAKNPSEAYAQLFTSRSVMDLAIEQLNLRKYYDIDNMDRLRSHMQERTNVRVSRESLIEVSFTDRNPEMSAAVVNALVAGMYEVGLRMSKDAARRQIEFYDQLILETRARLNKADEELLKVEVAVGLTRMKGQEEAATSAVADLKGQIAGREVDLAKLRRGATDQHPDVQRSASELGALREQLARLENPKTQSRIETGQGASAGVSAGVSATVGASAGTTVTTTGKTDLLVVPADYPALRRAVEPARREVRSLSEVLQDLQRTRESTRVDEARELTTIVVLDAAITPTLPSGPSRSRTVLVGLAGGLLLGLVWAYMTALVRAVRVAPAVPALAERPERPERTERPVRQAGQAQMQAQMHRPVDPAQAQRAFADTQPMDLDLRSQPSPGTPTVDWRRRFRGPAPAPGRAEPTPPPTPRPSGQESTRT